MAVNIDWGKILEAGAQIAGSYAQSKAAGRLAEATANQRQDQGAQTAYTTDKSLDLNALINAYEAELKRSQGLLDERAAALKEPTTRAGTSVRGDILANVQDVGFNAPPGVNVTSFSGGLRPSLLSANSRALGGQMSKEALMDALSGTSTPSPFSAMQPLDLSSITGRTSPTQTDLPQPSGLDKVMEQIALAAGVSSAIGGAVNAPAAQRAQAQTVAGQLATNPYRGVGPVVPGAPPPNTPWAP